METFQEQLNALQTSVKRQRLLNIALLGVIVVYGFIAAVRPIGDATFDNITCKGWKVADADGKVRIAATILAEGNAIMGWLDKDGKLRIAMETLVDGEAGVAWLDKDEKRRMIASTSANGDAGVTWKDKDGKSRIEAATFADGQASVQWIDKDGKERIGAATLADGTVILPTKDLEPPKKP